MPAARLATDPLWQFLCPAWSQLNPVSASRLLRRPSAPAWTCLHVASPARRMTAPGTPQERHDVAPSRRAAGDLDRRGGFERARGRDRHGNRANTAARTSSPQRIEYHPLETTEFLYGRLQSTAIHGDVQRCRAIAEHLVGYRKEVPSVQIYNSLILSNIHHHDGSAWRVAELLDEMRAEGLHPDAGTCHAVLKVCAVHPDHLLRSNVLHFMQQKWYGRSVDGAHDVVAGLLREGLFEQALNELDKMRSDGVAIASWLDDMAVYMLCDAGEIDEAFRIMRIHFDAGRSNISRSLWLYLLDKGSQARHHDATSLAWTSQVNQGYLNPSSGICLNVLSTAAHAGDATLGTEVFAHLSKRGTAFQAIHYELLIAAYLNADPPDLVRAISILTIMPLEKLVPTALETRTLYAHLRKEPSLVHLAFDTLRQLHAEDRPIPIAALNLLVECHIEQNNLPEAMKLYKLIHTFAPMALGAQKSFANIETFNLLLRGCRRANPPAARQASFLVSELLALRVTPTALTYDRLILVFLEASKAALASSPPTPDDDAAAAARARGLQLLDYAFRHFADMQPLGWMPRFGTLELLAVQLARTRDERCWDVLQMGEDHARTVEGFAAKSVWLRRNVESAWTTASESDEGGEQGGGEHGREGSSLAAS